MLDRTPDRSAVAIAIAPQMEGFAAARLAVPKSFGGPFGALDLSWVNSITRTRVRTRIDLGAELTLSREDMTLGKQPHYLLGWMSVSPHELLLRPSRRSKLTIRVKPDGSWQRLADYPSWPAVSPGWTVQSDAVVIDNVGIAMGMAALNEGSSVLLAQPLGPGSQPLVATSLAPPSSAGRLSSTQWTYKAHHVGAMVTIFDRQSRSSRAYFAPFLKTGGLGAPEAAASFDKLQLDLPICSSKARQTTTRYVAPVIGGKRHLLTIDAVTTPLRLELRRGVFYGSKALPCVAAWYAKSMTRGATRHAIIDADGSGWLLREKTGGFEYRPITCQLRGEASATP
jgi:hypothetical protein